MVIMWVDPHNNFFCFVLLVKLAQFLIRVSEMPAKLHRNAQEPRYDPMAGSAITYPAR